MPAVNCPRCAERLELIALLGSVESCAETWSGRIDCEPEKVWYDVSRAKQTIKACGLSIDAIVQMVSVRMLWDTQVSKSFYHDEHLDHVDANDPVILVTTHADDNGDWVTLVDGIHRVARAHRDGVEFIRAIRFGIEFSRSLRIQPEDAVLSELMNEVIATGGKVDLISSGMIISGGSPAPSTADDHPLRQQYVFLLRSGSLIVPV